MTPFPITYCLFTSNKGHFGKSTFTESLDSFSRALPLSQYEARLAHIKVSDNGMDANEMRRSLELCGFEVIMSYGNWSHADAIGSHQTEYLKDMAVVYNSVKTPYVLHAEDDFQVSCYRGELAEHLATAIRLLESDTDLLQVRICRFSNEIARIRGLMAKHGIDGRVNEIDSSHFRHNDLSLHPSLFRARDLRAAVLTTIRTNLPKHVEMGLSQALKLISLSDTPFACLNPDNIRVGHIGVQTDAERDDLTKPLIAT